MTGVTGSVAEQFMVRSPDGVDLAVWADGQGPPLVLVHGSLQDHTISAALVAELRADFTTMAMDRRGFGASGDRGPYSLDAEFADVAAVVDVAADRTGRPVAMWGHSFGASCAMGGASRSDHVGRLVLYEPSLGLSYPPGWIDRADKALTEGDHERVSVMVFRDLLDFTDEQIDALRTAPEWPGRVATAPTVVREARAEQEWTYRPGVMGGITAPTLLLAGSESPPMLRKATDAALAAIPRSGVRMLDGHAHIAHRTDPALVAAIIRDFVSS
ncbi:MAG: alpha/beta fold hydrolase [Actinomycetes bacterium]